jgi:hypothetical protein
VDAPKGAGVAGSVAAVWRVALAVPNEAAATFEAALKPVCCAVSLSAAEAGMCRIEWLGLAAGEPDGPALDLALAIAAAAAGVSPPEVTIESLPDRDWLAENRERSLPAASAGF